MFIEFLSIFALTLNQVALFKCAAAVFRTAARREKLITRKLKRFARYEPTSNRRTVFWFILWSMITKYCLPYCCDNRYSILFFYSINFMKITISDFF